MTGLRRALTAIGAAGLVAGLAAALLIAGSDHQEARGAIVALALVVGWSFIGTGLYAWDRRPDNGTGALMTAVGFAWFLVGLGSSDVPGVFAAGLMFNALFYAVLIHLLLAFPTGRLERARDRWLAAGAYFAALPLQVAPALLFDTPNDDCERCPPNPLLLAENDALQQLFSNLQALVAIPIVAAVAVITVQRRRRARGAQRAALGPILWAGAALLAAVIFQLVALAAQQDEMAEVGFFITVAAMVAVPWGFLVGLLRSRIVRGAAVSELVARLGSASTGPRELRAALADALGDPSLTLRYWLPDGERWIDAEGREAPDPAEAAAATMVRHEGRPVAALVHDPRLAEHRDLLETVSAAAALALENQRLGAALRARVEELRASRARIVQASYSARRKLERDLHDGAQQRLVALALDLRLARNKVDADPAAAAALLDASIEELAQATEELRELARGIHPALLTDRGLGPALDALATRAPLPVEIGAVPQERLPGPVEAAAYFVVAEALTNVAKYAEATHAAVTIARANGRLVVEVRDDGVGGAQPGGGTGLRGLADRLAALDGRLDVTSPPGDGTTVRAEVPCE